MGGHEAVFGTSLNRRRSWLFLSIQPCRKMSNYTLEFLTVLIIEDSQFVRSLICSVLNAMGVGNVVTSVDGEDAILMLAKGTAEGASNEPVNVDIVICDKVMPKVDGLMVLRWLRQHKRSPNRFMPFIMLTAAADMDVVEAARDAGTTEFIAKPFSAESILQRILSVIDHPRMFVYSPGYFGPCRRRLQRPRDGEDRRKITDDDIRVVYAEKTPSPLTESGPKVWHFHLPKSLKAKVGGSGGGTGTIDMKLLDEAESQIGQMEDDYADWVRKSIAALVQAVNRCIENPKAASVHYEAIHDIALELRGQGGVFGYPLVTTFGKSLYEYTSPGQRGIDNQHIELVKAHVDGISAVTRNKIKGDGGEVGADLVKGLATAKQKYEDRAA